MIYNSEPKLIEYNIRFGDPECQILMMRLRNDLLNLILSSVNNNLKKEKLIWTNEPGITVVAASKGYPEKFEKNYEITNIKKIKFNSKRQLFHAGTIKKNNKILSNGGRVLNATVLSSSLQKQEKLH